MTTIYWKHSMILHPFVFAIDKNPHIQKAIPPHPKTLHAVILATHQFNLPPQGLPTKPAEPQGKKNLCSEPESFLWSLEELRIIS